MKKIFLVLFILGMSLSLWAQQRSYFNYQKQNFKGQDYPGFYSKKARKSSVKINQTLLLKLVQNTDSITSPDSLSWQTDIFFNNKNIIAFSVKDKDNHEKNFAFNAANGSLINIAEMFTPYGLNHIKKAILKNFQSVSQQQVLLAKNAEKCIKDDLGNFKLTPDTLLVFSTNCFNVAANGNLSKDTVTTGFSSAALAPYLNIYGKSLLGITKKPKPKHFKSTVVSGLYEGKLGNQNVVILLEQPIENSLQGVFYYPDTQETISFSGKFRSNKLETVIKGASLRVVISSGFLTGTLKKNAKKTLYLKLEKN